MIQANLDDDKISDRAGNYCNPTPLPQKQKLNLKSQSSFSIEISSIIK
jgi:hypothetical protein